MISSKWTNKIIKEIIPLNYKFYFGGIFLLWIKYYFIIYLKMNNIVVIKYLINLNINKKSFIEIFYEINKAFIIYLPFIANLTHS